MIIIVPCSETIVRYWPGGKSFESGLQQLGADQHRVEAAEEEEEPDADEVLQADHLVVGREAEVAPDPGRLAHGQVDRAPEHAADGIVEEAEADEPADDREDVAEQQRDVVLIGRRDEVDVRADALADPLPDRVPDQREHDRRRAG